MSTDLKLLVDVAWANRNGQVDYQIEFGFVAASARLVKAGLLVTNSTGPGVQITGDGWTRIAELEKAVSR
jgi:hypothetical protein